MRYNYLNYKISVNVCLSLECNIFNHFLGKSKVLYLVLQLRVTVKETVFKIKI